MSSFLHQPSSDVPPGVIACNPHGGVGPLSSKVNLHHAMNLRVGCGACLVTLRPKYRPDEKTWGAVNRFVRELSRSLPLSHHAWGIGGDNVGLIHSTKAPSRTLHSEILERTDWSFCRELWVIEDSLRECVGTSVPLNWGRVSHQKMITPCLSSPLAQNKESRSKICTWIQVKVFENAEQQMYLTSKKTHLPRTLP